MNTKHTQGAWTTTNGRLVIGGQIMPVIAPDGKTHEEAAANAQLIAAAPDLLEAAKFALKELESWAHDQFDGTWSLKSSLAKFEPIRAAIAKAEGGVA